jgi:hypothetical protein
MFKTARSSVVIAALLLSSLMVSTSAIGGAGFLQSAKAQTTAGEQILGGLTNLRDQIVKGGNHVADQITKGGLAGLKSAAAFVGIHNVQLYINSANKDLAKGNSSGAVSDLKRVDKALVNDSSLMYGLGQRISQLAQNSSAISDSHSRDQLAAIGTDLKNLALNTVGARAVSSGK